jgi:hypothetical protein
VLKDNVSILTILTEEGHVYQNWICERVVKQPGLVETHNQKNAL